MGGTKIVVVQLRELIKTAIFALIGIVLIIMLIYFFIPKNSDGNDVSQYTPGTYSAQILLHNTPVRVEVTVTENEIVAIDLKDMAEIQEVFFPLVNPTFDLLAKEIISQQTTAVPLSSNAEFTSRILVDAVERALSEARVNI